MGRRYYTLSLDYEMHWHCEDNGHIYSSYLSESFVRRMFRFVMMYCEDNTYIIVIVIHRSDIFDLGLLLLLSRGSLTFFDNFDHRVRTTLSLSDFGLHCGSAITVVERLQRYNCIWLTYIDNIEQNILLYIEV